VIYTSHRRPLRGIRFRGPQSFEKVFNAMEIGEFLLANHSCRGRSADSCVDEIQAISQSNSGGANTYMLGLFCVPNFGALGRETQKSALSLRLLKWGCVDAIHKQISAHGERGRCGLGIVSLAAKLFWD
jgi:hypothetical protein